MTVTDAAKLLAQHIAQGRGDWQMAAFQWQRGSELITDIIPREGVQVLEVYSNQPETEPVELDDLI
ncbi:MAG: hypothetical protein ACREA9_19940 [Pyrinomonadaceae bacterium]